MAVLNINEADKKFESNVEMKSKSFGIGDASAIIDILRNRMYSKPIQTLVQEYICNARDAMIEAGTLDKRKIVVTAPTKLACQFRVRDYGVGLSQDRVENIFTMYGNSTKRSTNNQIGGYGLGAKSAWAYTDSFTVVSFYNGTKTTYLCHVGKDNVGSMDVLNTTTTTEDNGVEIVVTVKPQDTGAFINACNRCLTFWDTNIYELNIGLTPTFNTIHDDGFVLVLQDNENRYSECHNIIVDDIVFPIHDSSFNKWNIGVSFKCKTGDVDVAPSRETIINNDKYKAFVKKCNDYIAGLVKKHDAITDIQSKVESALKLGNITYLNEIRIDDNFSIYKGNTLNCKLTRRLANKNGSVVFDDYNSKHNMSFNLDKGTYLFVISDSEKYAPSKIKHYLSNKSLGRNLRCIVVNDLSIVNKYVLDKITVVDVSTLAMPPRLPSTSKKTTVKTDEMVKVLEHSTWGNLNSYEAKLIEVRSTPVFKVPYSGFREHEYKISHLLQYTNKTCALALNKEQYADSTLPTLEEYEADIIKTEQQYVGNYCNSNLEKIVSDTGIKIDIKFGKAPAHKYLPKEDREKHDKLINKYQAIEAKLLKKFPLISYSLVEESIEYVQLLSKVKNIKEIV